MNHKVIIAMIVCICVITVAGIIGIAVSDIYTKGC